MASIHIEVGVDSFPFAAELIQRWATIVAPSGTIGEDRDALKLSDGKVTMNVNSVDEETIRHLFALTAGKPADLTQNIGNKGRRGTGRKGGRQAKQQTPPPAQPQGTEAQKEAQPK